MIQKSAFLIYFAAEAWNPSCRMFLQALSLVFQFELYKVQYSHAWYGMYCTVQFVRYIIFVQPMHIISY